jgi:formylmethanofuran dehydrogenase subunit E
MIDPRQSLEAGQQLHGRKCPAMPVGLRAGGAAMNTLGASFECELRGDAVIEEYGRVADGQRICISGQQKALDGGSVGGQS